MAKKNDQELKVRAVRLVDDRPGEYPSPCAAAALMA